MIPLYYMDDTVRRRAEFAEKGNGASQSHASNQKMALVSFISRRHDSLRGEEGSQVRFYFRRFLVELTSVLNSLSEERGRSLGLPSER